MKNNKGEKNNKRNERMDVFKKNEYIHIWPVDE